MKKEVVESILENFDTPIYVFDIDALKERIKFLREHLSKRIELCYAIKANTFIIKEINDDVDRVEVCSPGEYSICEEANITPEKIVISGVYKTPSVIDYMMSTCKKIGRYTVESLEQLKLLDELSKKHNIKIDVLLRLTSANQFGINEEDIEERYAVIKFKDGVDLIPSNIELSAVEISLVNTMSRELVLKSYIDSVRDKYDYIIIDCMPSLGIMTVNALACADTVLIPVQAAYLPVKGLQQLIKTIYTVKRRLNPNLEIEGILLTMVDNRTNYAKDIVLEVNDVYGKTIPVFPIEIPLSVRAAEISSMAKSIYDYDPKGKAAFAYMSLTKEVLAHGC